MHIFRWLMKHPIIILAVYFLSIAAILFNMTRNSSIETGVTETTAQVENVDSTEVDLTVAPKIEPSTLTSSLVDEQAKTEESDTTNAKVDLTDSEVKTEVTTTTQADLVKTESESTPPTDEVAPQAIVSSEQANEQFSEMSAEELLLMAREAYWNNGLEESAQIYQQLIQLNPNVVDYKGELGNVYWRQGFPEKAAELYAEISAPMIADGNTDKVANMVGFIGLFFPEKATEIHNLLQAGK